jgi:hypothetical protein
MIFAMAAPCGTHAQRVCARRSGFADFCADFQQLTARTPAERSIASTFGATQHDDFVFSDEY